MGKYVIGWLTAGTILVLLGGCRSTGSGCASGSCAARSPSTHATPSDSPGYIPPTGGRRIMEGSGSR